MQPYSQLNSKPQISMTGNSLKNAVLYSVYQIATDKNISPLAALEQLRDKLIEECSIDNAEYFSFSFMFGIFCTISSDTAREISAAFKGKKSKHVPAEFVDDLYNEYHTKYRFHKRRIRDTNINRKRYITPIKCGV